MLFTLLSLTPRSSFHSISLLSMILHTLFAYFPTISFSYFYNALIETNSSDIRTFILSTSRLHSSNFSIYYVASKHLLVQRFSEKILGAFTIVCSICPFQVGDKQLWISFFDWRIDVYFGAKSLLVRSERTEWLFLLKENQLIFTNMKYQNTPLYLGPCNSIELSFREMKS